MFSTIKPIMDLKSLVFVNRNFLCEHFFEWPCKLCAPKGTICYGDALKIKCYHETRGYQCLRCAQLFTMLRYESLEIAENEPEQLLLSDYIDLCERLKLREKDLERTTELTIVADNFRCRHGKSLNSENCGECNPRAQGEYLCFHTIKTILCEHSLTAYKCSICSHLINIKSKFYIDCYPYKLLKTDHIRTVAEVSGIKEWGLITPSIATVPKITNTVLKPSDSSNTSVSKTDSRVILDEIGEMDVPLIYDPKTGKNELPDPERRSTNPLENRHKWNLAKNKKNCRYGNHFSNWKGRLRPKYKRIRKQRLNLAEKFNTDHKPPNSSDDKSKGKTDTRSNKNKRGNHKQPTVNSDSKIYVSLEKFSNKLEEKYEKRLEVLERVISAQSEQISQLMTILGGIIPGLIGSAVRPAN